MAHGGVRDPSGGKRELQIRAWSRCEVKGEFMWGGSSSPPRSESLSKVSRGSMDYTVQTNYFTGSGKMVIFLVLLFVLH